MPNKGTNLAYGCVLASWTSGKFIVTEITFEGNAGAGWVTISSDDYDIHPKRGAVIARVYVRGSDTAVDWSTYRAYQDAGNVAFRCTYWLYDPATNVSTQYTNEAQTVRYLDYGIAPFDPTTGALTASAVPEAFPLFGDYLSLGDPGTRPTDATHGTGIWADKTGIYGLLADVQQVTFSAATGVITAGAGAVVLDASGITIAGGSSDVNYLKWTEDGDLLAKIYSHISGSNIDTVFQSNSLDATYSSASMILRAITYDSAHYAQTYVVATATTAIWRAWVDSAQNEIRFDDTQFWVRFVSGNKLSFTDSTQTLTIAGTAPAIQLSDTTASAKDLLVTVGANAATFQEAAAATDILRLDLANKNVVINSAALATNATDGFLYITSSAGVPSGTPTTFTGRLPIHIDSTNHNLYFYDGAWRTAIGAAGAPVGSAYVTIGSDGTLTSERALTGTSNQIVVTDNGAGSTVVLSTPQNIHTGATPQFTRLGLGTAADATRQLKMTGDITMANNTNIRALSSGGTELVVFGTNGSDRIAYGDTSLWAGGMIFRPGTATDTMFLTQTARVGIGTQSPSSKFHVKGTSNQIQAIIQGHSAQATNLTEWQDSSNNILLQVTSAGHLQFADAVNMVLGTSTGTIIGTATSQKLAFHNATPVIQRAGAAQAAVATTGATNTTPYGYTTAAQADAIVTLVNEIRAALVEKGLIKGAA